MKYFAYLLLLLLIGVSVYYMTQNDSAASKTKAITVTGKILSGDVINKSYCAEALYIVPDTLVYPTLQLRNSDLEILSNRQYVGSVVDIKGIYDPDLAICEALTCDCEPYIIVEEVSEN